MLVPMVTPQRPHHLLNSLSSPKGGSLEPGYEHAQCVVCVIMLEQKRLALALRFIFGIGRKPVQEYTYKTDNKKN